MPGHAAALYGELTKAPMEVLRGTEGPMRLRAITLAIMQGRKLAVDYGDLVETMRKRVGAPLRTMKARQTARSVWGHGLKLV